MIGNNDGPYKIGYTSNIDQRLESMHIGSPDDFVLHASRDVENKQEAMDCERNAHRMLAEYRIRGEWFRCKLAAASKAIKADYVCRLRRPTYTELQNVIYKLARNLPVDSNVIETPQFTAIANNSHKSNWMRRYNR